MLLPSTPLLHLVRHCPARVYPRLANARSPYLVTRRTSISFPKAPCLCGVCHRDLHPPTHTHTWTRARFPVHAAVWMSVLARLRARPARSAAALRTPSALQLLPSPPPPPPSPGHASWPPPLSPIDRRTHQRTNCIGTRSKHLC